MRNAFLTIIAIGLSAVFSTGCTAKIKKARHLSRADKYYNSGQYAKAEVEYLNVIQLDSANSHAISRLGLIHYEEGRHTAFAILMKASELNPDDTDIHLKLGSIYLSIGRLSEAHTNALFVLSKKPADPEAPVLLSESVTNQAQADLVRTQLDNLSKQIGD